MGGYEGLPAVVLDALEQGVAVTDQENRVTFVNKGWHRLFGASAAPAAPASPWPEVVAALAAAGWQMAAAESDEGAGATTHGELHGPDGRVVTVMTTPMPGGGVLHVFDDVTAARSHERVLGEMRERYELAFRSTNEGLYDWDIAADTIFFSARARDLFHLPEGRLSPGDWVARILPEDIGTYRAAHIAHLKGETGRFTCEYRMWLDDGRVVWVRQHGMALRDAAGKATRLTGSVGDVTDVMESRRALEHSENRYAVAMDALDEGVYEWDLATGTVQVTLRLRQLFGLPDDAETMPARMWTERIHPADIDTYRARQRALLKGEVGSLELEYRIRAGDGAALPWRWVRQRGIAVRDATGWTLRVIGSAGDITDRKAAEQALEESRAALAREREILKATVENMDQGLVMADRDLNVIAYNRRCADLFGLSERDLATVTSLPALLKRMCERGEVKLPYDKALAVYLGDAACRTVNTMEIRRRDGRVLEARNVPLADGGFVRTFTDTTERNRLERDLKRAKEQAEQALSNLQQTQHSLIQAEKMASLGELVAGVAHEINTPVGITMTTSSHLDEKTREIRRLFDAGKMRRQDFLSFLDVAENACKLLVNNSARAASLIQSFKQVAVDQTSDQRRRFNLKSYIDEVLLSLGPKLKRTNFTIALTCDDDLTVDSVPGPLSQVITNMVMNSMIHGFAGRDSGHMHIAVTMPEPGIVELRYSDDGVGMSDAVLKKVFDPFFTTKRGQGGSGLGMNIVYNIVTQTLKGSIRAESAEGKGATFVVRFPATLSEEASAVPA